MAFQDPPEDKVEIKFKNYIFYKLNDHAKEKYPHLEKKKKEDLIH